MTPLLLFAACVDPAPSSGAPDPRDTGPTGIEDPTDTGTPAGAPTAWPPGVRGAQGAGLTVVIGGGVAGLATAMDLRGPVVLLEASDTLGGRANWAGARMFFVGNEEAVEAGAATDLDQALADWPLLTRGPLTPGGERFLTESDAVHDRLVDLGLAFTLMDLDPILHAWLSVGVDGGGPALVQALVDALPDTVDVRLGAPATALVLEGGRAVGVQTTDGFLAADTVVVASGGFVNRADVVERVMDPYPWAWDVGQDAGATGWAFDQAEALGLGVAQPGAIGWNINVVGVPDEAGHPLTLNGGSPIWVDPTGARFVDEASGWSLMLWGAVREHGGAEVWGVEGHTPLEGQLGSALDTFEAAEEGGAVVCVADPAEVPAATGIDADGFAATLAAVQQIVDGAGTDPYGRDASTFPDLGAPCAFRIGRLASKNFGGLAVDEDGRVLDAGGAVVSGLWAVGEAAGMAQPGLGGETGFDGSLSAIVWGGWRAAAAMNAERWGR